MENDPDVGTRRAHSGYLRFLDHARHVLVLATAVIAVCFIVCVNRDDYLRGTLRGEPDMWTWGAWLFGYGVGACFLVAFLFVVEHLARPLPPRTFSLGPVLLRSLLILAMVAGICAWMGAHYGYGPALGAVLATMSALGTLHERGMTRVLLALFAVTATVLTVLGAS